MLYNNIYNLAFGDYNESAGTIDGRVVTNNNDSQKVLATVATTLYVFAEKYLNIWVYATGSNMATTRLLQKSASFKL
jgi:hypothetical protein